MDRRETTLLNQPAQPTAKGANARQSLTPAPSRVLQRKCACGSHTIASGERTECNKNRRTFQRATRNLELETSNSDGVLPIVHDVLRTSGQPVDAVTRAFMEPRFGHDFSHVRTYTDARATESARAVNALVLKMLWDEN